MEKVKKLVNKGNVSCIIVKRDGEIVEVNAELLGEKVDDLGDVVSEKIHKVKDKLSNKE